MLTAKNLHYIKPALQHAMNNRIESLATRSLQLDSKFVDLNEQQILTRCIERKLQLKSAAEVEAAMLHAIDEFKAHRSAKSVKKSLNNLKQQYEQVR